MSGDNINKTYRTKQFDFGENWKDFSMNALSEIKVREARRDLLDLLQGVNLKDKTFLDIGFGQGLSLLLATELGAKTVGNDINNKCKEAMELNRKYFNIEGAAIPVVMGSVLDELTLNRIRSASPSGNGKYDIVYSWGVLHHTGDLTKAVNNSCSLVDNNGRLILAIYNKHWTSKIWLFIKWLYNKSPRFIKKILIRIFYPIIWLAKLAVTGKNPRTQYRGMDFYYDVVDWVGGYPYEYQSEKETKEMLKKSGFECTRFIPANVPTGCNQFVFIKSTHV